MQAREPADHQRGERGDHCALERKDQRGAVPRELALQVAQHQEEEEVPHPVLPEEEQKEREDGGLRADRAPSEEEEEEEERGAAAVLLTSVFLLCLRFQCPLMFLILFEFFNKCFYVQKAVERIT